MVGKLFLDPFLVGHGEVRIAVWTSHNLRIIYPHHKPLKCIDIPRILQIRKRQD